MKIIEDNFLDQNKFDKLQNTMMVQETFPWVFADGIDYIDDVNLFQFIHIFYEYMPGSPFHDEMIPILELINPISLWRIKANLLTRTSEIVENKFHSDLESKLPEEKLKQWTTSIFYVNTNNGYTEFEDGTKVGSVANRMVTFPTNIKHRGTSCTDQNTRIVINFNYYTI